MVFGSLEIGWLSKSFNFVQPGLQVTKISTKRTKRRQARMLIPLVLQKQKVQPVGRFKERTLHLNTNETPGLECQWYNLPQRHVAPTLRRIPISEYTCFE